MNRTDRPISFLVCLHCKDVIALTALGIHHCTSGVPHEPQRCPRAFSLGTVVAIFVLLLLLLSCSIGFLVGEHGHLPKVEKE